MCDDGTAERERERESRMTRTYTPSLLLTYGGEEDSEEDREENGGEGERAEKETRGEMPAGRMDFIFPELNEPL